MKKELGDSVHARPEALQAARPLRLIIADDDRDTVLTLMMVLRHEGHDVRGVHTGPQVLSALTSFEADAVLLDIALPELSGWEVARKIKEHYAHGRAPMLIGISGEYKHSVDKILSEMIGFDHYLVKPYEPSDVLKLLAPLRLPRDA
jgi:DNA-binding response OmpR family regulator